MSCDNGRNPQQLVEHVVITNLCYDDPCQELKHCDRKVSVPEDGTGSTIYVRRHDVQNPS